MAENNPNAPAFQGSTSDSTGGISLPVRLQEVAIAAASMEHALTHAGVGLGSWRAPPGSRDRISVRCVTHHPVW